MTTGALKRPKRAHEDANSLAVEGPDVGQVQIDPAVTGIGNVTPLAVSASTLSANTTNGNISIDSLLSSPVTVAALTTGVGNVDCRHAGGGNVTESWAFFFRDRVLNTSACCGN